MYTTSHQYIVLSGTLWSRGKPHLWANNPSFRVMTTDDRAHCACTLKISEVAPSLSRSNPSVSSHGVHLSRPSLRQLIEFPFWVAISSASCIGRCLLERMQSFGNHHFSSDGNLFAAYSFRGVDIWKYTSGRLSFTPWRVFQPQSMGPIHLSPLLFSPTLSSILGHPTGALEVWRLDGPPIVARPDTHTSVAVPSRCALKSATSHRLDSTIAISHLLSQTPSQFIDTSAEIRIFALIDNVFLVLDSTNSWLDDSRRGRSGWYFRRQKDRSW